MQDLTRRTMLAASAVLPWATGANAADGGSPPLSPAAKTLVAYFTRSGNTRVIAGTLHRELKADLFEILPAEPYPEDYEQTVAQADGETKRGYEPPLAAPVRRFASYDTVLGSPVWGMTAPPVIRSFLHAHDWQGKTILPFITHGGYGIGNSLDVIRAHAPAASVTAPFVMEADQERRTLTQVRGWLASIQPG